jgi:hypothetical protein
MTHMSMWVDSGISDTKSQKVSWALAAWRSARRPGFVSRHRPGTRLACTWRAIRSTRNTRAHRTSRACTIRSGIRSWSEWVIFSLRMKSSSSAGPRKAGPQRVLVVGHRDAETGGESTPTRVDPRTRSKTLLSTTRRAVKTPSSGTTWARTTGRMVVVTEPGDHSPEKTRWWGLEPHHRSNLPGPVGDHPGSARAEHRGSRSRGRGCASGLERRPHHASDLTPSRPSPTSAWIRRVGP